MQQRDSLEKPRRPLSASGLCGGHSAGPISRGQTGTQKPREAGGPSACMGPATQPTHGEHSNSTMTQGEHHVLCRESAVHAKSAYFPIICTSLPKCLPLSARIPGTLLNSNSGASEFTQHEQTSDLGLFTPPSIAHTPAWSVRVYSLAHSSSNQPRSQFTGHIQMGGTFSA